MMHFYKLAFGLGSVNEMMLKTFDFKLSYYLLLFIYSLELGSYNVFSRN